MGNCNFRVKKDAFTKNYNKGGLKMVSVMECIVIITYVNAKMVTQNDCLLSMLNLDITKLLLCGKAYITERIKYVRINL